MTLYTDNQNFSEMHAHSSMIEMFGSMMCPKGLCSVVKQIQKGFKLGLKPKLTNDGTSGTYFLRGPSRQPLAVFKPIDEEAFAPNNPRDNVGAFGQVTFKTGVLSGEACIREVSAYLLDHQNFSDVPSTTMVEATHDSFRKFKFSNFKIQSECNDYVDMIHSIIAPENQRHEHDHHSDDNHNDNHHRHFLKIGSL